MTFCAISVDHAKCPHVPKYTMNTHRKTSYRGLAALVSLSVIGTSACKGDNNSSPASAPGVGEEKPPGEPKAAKPAATKEASKPAPLSDDAETIAVVSEAIGPVRLGMQRAQTDSLSLAVHPNYSGMTVPYNLYFDGDVVSGISLSLAQAKRPVTVLGREIPAGATLENVAEIVGGCGEPELAIGGTTRHCAEGIKVTVGSGSPDEVWIRIDSK